MKSKHTLSAFLLLVSNILFGQIHNVTNTTIFNHNNRSEYKRLRPGDYLPFKEYEFNSTKNTPKPLKLSTLKESKLIVLDFWSKYCSSCISAFPKMQELQVKFPEIQIILITKNNVKELEYLFRNSYNVKTTTLPMVFSDTIFSQILFPHNTVPFHVWIDQNGKVIATVDPEETNENNIKSYLSKAPLSLEMREDNVIELLPVGLDRKNGSLLDTQNKDILEKVLYFNSNKTLHKSNSNTAQSGNRLGNLNYSIFMKGMPQYSGHLISEKTDSNGNKIGLKLFNITLQNILMLAYKDLVEEPNINDQLIKLKFLPEDNNVNYEEITDTTNQKRQYNNNLYSYESQLNSYSNKKAINKLKYDIINCFNLALREEERVINCVVFKIEDTSKVMNIPKTISIYPDEQPGLLTINNKNILVKQSISDLISFLGVENRKFSDPFIIDETNLPATMIGTFTLNIPNLKISNSNILQIKKDLKPYGITIDLENRTKKVIIIYSPNKNIAKNEINN